MLKLNLKIGSILMGLAMVVCLLPNRDFAYQNTTNTTTVYMNNTVLNTTSKPVTNTTTTIDAKKEDFEYTIEKHKVRITKYKGTDKVVIIPHMIEGEIVTSIGEDAFANCSQITSITIPETATNIEKGAFSNCISLRNINIPEGVTSIENNTFSGCSSLESIRIPDSVLAIRWNAFSECSSLTNVVIPEGVRSIETAVFKNCRNLTNIDIPKSVTDIENSAFSGCSSLTNIILSEGVTSIGYGAFKDCKSLTSINIPSSVKWIGTSAFSGCSSLTSITIPEGITSIKEEVFYRCSNLNHIKLPNSLTKIDFMSFYECSSLTDIIIPESVVSIEEQAFSGCDSLISVTIPSAVTGNLGNVFSYCRSLKNIEVDINNSNYISENGILFTKDGTTLVAYPAAKENTDYIIPDEVDTVLPYAFAHCKNLVRLTFPNNIMCICGDICADPNLELVIYGYENSYAEQWANRYYYRFESIGKRTVEDKETYTVTFKDFNGTILKKETVNKGQSATAPEMPEYRDNYYFDGWDKSFDEITSDLTMIAICHRPQGSSAPIIVYYSVTFRDYDGSLLKTAIIKKGQVAPAPKEPMREGYTFAGWDNALDNITADLEVTATYIKNENPTATFKTSLATPKETVHPSEEFQISVNISDLQNIENGLIVLGGQLEYDKNILDIIEITTASGSKWNPSTVNEENFKFVTDADEFVTGTETVFQIKFKVKDTITEAVSTSVRVRNIEASNGLEDITSNDAETQLQIEIPEDAFLTSEKYKIEDGMISRIAPKTVFSEFMKNVETNREIIVLDQNGNLVGENEFLGTGMTLKVGEDLEYTLVVTGDMDGNGKINLTDLATLKLHLIEKEILTGTKCKAADMNADEAITITDLAQIKLVIIGLMSI